MLGMVVMQRNREPLEMAETLGPPRGSRACPTSREPGAISPTQRTTMTSRPSFIAASGPVAPGVKCGARGEPGDGSLSIGRLRKAS